MKRRVISFITVLAMCLSLCPTGALAADQAPDAGLCPHHQVHTEECGYIPPAPGRDCAHEHDESCFITETRCVHQHTEDCYPEPSSCTHECREDSGCVMPALDCPHVHDEFCGYAPEDMGAPCMFVCRICPIEDLIGRLPRSVTPDNESQVEDQLDTILALYVELTGDEQEQLDLSRCFDLQAQLDAANTPMLLEDIPVNFTLYANKSSDKVYEVYDGTTLADPCGYTYTATKTSAVHVQSTGILRFISGGTIKSNSGSGVEVAAGGKLYIGEAHLTITGSTYGLDIASGATVELSGGRYTGGKAAIQTADGNFGSLLKNGYAYFDADGNPITNAGMKTAKEVVVKAQPKLVWESTDTVIVDYNGSPVDIARLPQAKITAPAEASEILSPYLTYSYRKVGDSNTAFKDFKADPPRNAGTYEIRASLPEWENYTAAETSSYLKLIINPIAALITAPRGNQSLIYDRTSQELVTAGTVHDGTVIEYAQKAGGPYSTAIPAETNAGNYTVYYRVVGNSNYTGQDEKSISVRIAPKPITPTIDVSEPSYVYDGSKKNPSITVRDGQTVIEDDQYTITWADEKGNTDDVLRTAGKYTATIANAASGNYTFSETVTVEIVEDGQNALSITGMPDHVYYGAKITTLDTTGGSENGTVKWSIAAGDAYAAINAESGELTIKDIGTVTVKAKREVPNYKTVEDTWTFTVEPKPVTAVVTVTPKTYDGNSDANVTAELKGGDLVNSRDSITINGLKGTYDDANTGTNKTVTLDSSAVVLSGDTNKYSVIYPATAKADITAKPVTVTVALSGNDLKTDNNTTPPAYSYVYDGNPKTPDVTVTYTEKGNTITIPSGNYTVTYSNNKNVGTNAAATVTANAGGNYTFNGGPATAKFEIRKAKAALNSTPMAKDLTYNGQLQDLVTVGTADGGTVVYCLKENGKYSETVPTGNAATTYTVYYKIKGDDNHSDTTTPSLVYVTIKPKEITPTITLSELSYVYDGNSKTPDVTVEDGGVTIDETEYVKSYSDNINAGTATVTVSNANGGNYIVNGTANFTIAKADPKDVTAPTPNVGLQYNGSAQELLYARGSSLDGTMVYSLDGRNFSEEIPTGTAVDSYTVSYKVLGDSNHKDSKVETITVSISKNTVTNPTITLSPNTFRYNGSQQIPTVTVRDDNGFLIAENEYVVSYSGKNTGSTNPVEVDTYTLTVTETGNSNYSFQSDDDQNTRTFEIVKADQEVLSITNTRDLVYYGDTIQLGTSGGTGNGTVSWSVNDDLKAEINSSSGLLTVKDVGGPIVVTAKRSAGENYSEISARWEFSASPKPVTAILTGVDRDYRAGDKSATVKAEVDSSDLVSGDSITISNLSGSFEDANVGTNKKITIPTPNPTVRGNNAGKYVITYPKTATASIKPIPATISTIRGATGLTYDAGKEQPLLTAAVTATGGTVVYSLDGVAFSQNIPTGKNAGAYKVYCKALGDSNHTDSTVGTATVTIGRQSVTDPRVELTPSEAPYDGSVQRPGVTVKDTAGRVIPESEYIIAYGTGNWKDKGTYTVTVTNASDGNYDITEKKATFTITTSESNPLEIVNKPGLVYYGGSPFTLSAVGGSGNGAITWSSDAPGVAEVDSNGLVTINGAGTVTITATKAASQDQNYAASTATYEFKVLPKSASVTVTLQTTGHVYNGSAIRPAVTVTANDGNVLEPTDYAVSYGNNTDAGTATVTVESKTGGNYAFEQKTESFVIAPGQAVFDPAPKGKEDLVYTGDPIDLVSAGTVNLGTVKYSLDGTNFSENIPTGTNAEAYTVWYKVEGTGNYAGIDAKSVEVTIAQATPTFTPPLTASCTSGKTLNESTLIGTPSVAGTFTWTNGDTVLTKSDLYQVTFVPDNANYETVTIEVMVTVTDPPAESDIGGNESTDIPVTPPAIPPAAAASNTVSVPSAAKAPMQTSVRNNTATTVLSAAAGDNLVKEAAATQSKNVVIRPEITGDVTKTEVSLPASTVSRLSSETNAALTVSTPVADVTIPNAALDTLSSAGGAVSVVTEQAENTVALTLTAGGEEVRNVPGGLTLTVPVEDAGPGTVAVLVHDDGTRETIRKSVADNGEMTIPLNGSATVEIVDNSREFADVPAETWAADAVAFASAHELFNGTSETTFSPEQPMSRAMLATVLYNLEGRPAQSLTNEFSDVSSDAWYAEGVSWAAANGITNGYGDGQFGPDDNVTREQFAVMLWKYTGSPAADGQALNFTDADQVSGYAAEALRWATANGILNGYDNGRLDPGGLATRAQAAQMLKNFMENV